MPFSASEFHTYHRLKTCGLRVYLTARGQQGAEPDEYHQLLARLGDFHERRHLELLGPHFNAYQDASRTREAVERREPLIYQPCMRFTSSQTFEVVGVPDFFILEQDNYLIRDCKLARRFNEDDHPEIFRQLELYGWLYENTFGRTPRRLEAFMGDSQIRIVPYTPANALTFMVLIDTLKNLSQEPYEAVGWTKCLDCRFNDFCLTRAQQRRDVALLPGVDQNLATAFHKGGIDTYDELLQRHTEATLRDFKKEQADRLVKVGKSAKLILLQARSFQSGEIVSLQPIILKPDRTLVMFDVEGIPPHLDYSERTYLWGLKPTGQRHGPYMPAFSRTGPDGDEQGWYAFLSNCHLLLTHRIR